MASADVVVIGGGANGTSTAFHLASMGVHRVILVERRGLAAGATGKSGSLVRTHYTNEAESRLAFESLKVFRTFRDVTGADCGFEPIGFVQIVGRGYEEALARNVDMQEGIGIKTTMLSTDDLRRLMPGIRVEDIGGGRLGTRLRICRSERHDLRVRGRRPSARRGHPHRMRGHAHRHRRATGWWRSRRRKAVSTHR